MTEFEKNLVFAGVDTHKDTHTLCLLDYMGRAVGTLGFPADAKGYDALAEKIGGRKRASASASRERARTGRD